jgi:hypothetical protein
VGFRISLSSLVEQSDAAAAAAAAAQDTADDAAQAAAAAAGVASAAADVAADAYSLAVAGVRYFVQAAAPAWTGAANTAVWIDTANGRRPNVWDGDSWEPQPLGPAAFTAGAVTADVLAGTAVDGKTVTGATVQTSADPAAQRLVLDGANGLRGFGTGSGGTAGPVNFQLKPDGTVTATGATITGEVRSRTPGAGSGYVRMRQVGVTQSGRGVLAFGDHTGAEATAQSWTVVKDTVGAATAGTYGAFLEVASQGYAGTAGPRLALNRENLADGVTFQGVARLSGATTLDVGGAIVTGAGNAGQVLVPISPAANWGGIGLNVYRDASGAVVPVGWFTNSGAFTPAGGEVLGTIPAGYWPRSTIPNPFGSVAVSVGQTVIQLEIRATDGKVIIPRPHTQAIGAGAVWAFSGFAPWLS